MEKSWLILVLLSFLYSCGNDDEVHNNVNLVDSNLEVQLSEWLSDFETNWEISITEVDSIQLIVKIEDKKGEISHEYVLKTLIEMATGNISYFTNNELESLIVFYDSPIFPDLNYKCLKNDIKVNEIKYHENEVLEENIEYIVKNSMYEDVAFLDSIIVNLNKVSDSVVYQDKLYISFIENLAASEGKDLEYYSSFTLTMASYVYGLSKEKGPIDLLNFTMNSMGGAEINLKMFEELTGERPKWEIEGTPSEPLNHGR